MVAKPHKYDRYKEEVLLIVAQTLVFFGLCISGSVLVGYAIQKHFLLDWGTGIFMAMPTAVIFFLNGCAIQILSIAALRRMVARDAQHAEHFERLSRLETLNLVKGSEQLIKSL